MHVYGFEDLAQDIYLYLVFLLFQILSDLQSHGPSSLTEPHDLYNLCLHAGLLPRNVDLSSTSLPLVGVIYKNFASSDYAKINGHKSILTFYIHVLY